MKVSKLLFLPLFFIGCNTSQPVKKIDDRPMDELSFIKKFHVADSLFSSEINDIKKTETYDKQKTELTRFITDSLPKEVKQWHAFVYKIKAESFPTDEIEVTLLIPQNTFLNTEQKYPELSNIVLSSKASLNDSSIKDSLKELLEGDNVLVTGSFEKDDTGNVNLDSNTDDINNKQGFIFSNPKISFQIKSIIKQK